MEDEGRGRIRYREFEIFEKELRFAVTEARLGAVGYMAVWYHIPLAAVQPS